MYMLAESTAEHASVNHTELEITIQDVRMAMQDCAILGPEKVIEDQEFEGEEDMRGVEGFIAWATGKPNREIRRVALEGTEGLQEDYLAGLSLGAILISRLT
jgi:transcription initiation factor TFIID subunit 3